jgi:ribosomal protein S18 acetylase RimI-like enzyme
MAVDIKPLTKDLSDDFFYFFDNAAFSDNPSWEGCFCFYYHFKGNESKWSRRKYDANRKAVKGLIAAGKMKGYLAYIENKPVGWCNVNDKKNYARLVSNKEIWQDRDEKVCSIVCFVIAPEHRGEGIAGKILDRICIDHSGSGYDYMEAYPAKEDMSDAGQYHGPLSMYIKAGFQIYMEFDDYSIVRRKL